MEYIFHELNLNWFESGPLPLKKSKISVEGLHPTSQTLLIFQFPDSRTLIYRKKCEKELKKNLFDNACWKKEKSHQRSDSVHLLFLRPTSSRPKNQKEKKGMWRLDNKIKFLTFNTKARKRKAPESTIRKVLTQISIAISYPMCEIESLQDLNFNFGIHKWCTATHKLVNV